MFYFWFFTSALSYFCLIETFSLSFTFSIIYPWFKMSIESNDYCKVALFVVFLINSLTSNLSYFNSIFYFSVLTSTISYFCLIDTLLRSSCSSISSIYFSISIESKDYYKIALFVVFFINLRTSNFSFLDLNFYTRLLTLNTL